MTGRGGGEMNLGGGDAQLKSTEEQREMHLRLWGRSRGVHAGGRWGCCLPEGGGGSKSGTIKRKLLQRSHRSEPLLKLLRGGGSIRESVKKGEREEPGI